MSITSEDEICHIIQNGLSPLIYNQNGKYHHALDIQLIKDKPKLAF